LIQGGIHQNQLSEKAKTISECKNEKG